MKILSRDFTILEKILIGLLCLVLLGLAYYQFVDKPVRASIEKAENEKIALNVELAAVQEKIAELERMQADLDKILTDPTINPMPSYNAIDKIRTILNDLLGDLGFRMTFSEVTRNGDQIRQNISMTFTTHDYDEVDKLLTELEKSEIRCKIGNLNVWRVYGYRYYTGEVIGAEYPNALNVNLSLTFYETMVGGKPDAGLPEEVKPVT